ncbi:MAG: hypothetical protein WCS99_19080 [Limisphaerales bacterium]
MSEAESLFLVLALLYCVECVGWVRRGTVAFRTRWRGRWRAVHPSLHLGGQRGGLVFAHPLPPLGNLLLSAQLPFSLSPDGLLAFVAPAVNPGGRPPQRGSFLRWGQIQSLVAEGRALKLNGTAWFKFSSAHTAGWLATALTRIARLAPEQRAAAIREFLAATLDPEAVRAQWAAARPGALRLRRWANSLFCFMFVVAPALNWHYGLKACWPVLVAGWLGHTITIGILFFRAHRRLYPEAGDERFTHFLTSLLAAPTAARAHDLLTRPLLERFHPLAVAQVLADAGEFRVVAQQLLRELRHPALPVCPPGEAESVERDSRAMVLEFSEALTRRAGLDPDALLAPPSPLDCACRSYCPRCEEQFIAPTGVCEDCGGLRLLPLAKPDDRRKPE